jgi:hypothetical protein
MYVCVCLLLQDLVQSCLRGEGGDIGGHVLRETKIRAKPNVRTQQAANAKISRWRLSKTHRSSF